jgi:hypothetical protein
MPSARLAQAPLAAARMLLDEGLEPVLQLTGRDRNRLGLQSDLLAAHALDASWARSGSPAGVHLMSANRHDVVAQLAEGLGAPPK